MNLNTPITTVECSNEITITITITDKNYTVNHKKRDILFLTITLANLDRFLQFLYHFNREQILHATVVKFTKSPNCVRNLLRKFK